jgi:hypothetical protein
MAVMDSFLITVDGSEHEVSTGTVRRLLDTSARFWLDLAGVDKSTADGLLRDTFGSIRWRSRTPSTSGSGPRSTPMTTSR